MAAFLQDRKRSLLCIATDQIEDHIDLLTQNLLEQRLSIIDHPAGSDGLEVRLIVAACRGNNSGTGMRCQLHGITAHCASSAASRVALYPVDARGMTVEPTLPRLARLADDTGGRVTQRTNDLAFGYERARQDLRRVVYAEGEDERVLRAVQQVADELGAPVDRLYAWRRKYAARPGADTGAPQTPEEKDAEIRRLRAELVRMQEREIVLKKSLGILSETPESGMPRSKP